MDTSESYIKQSDKARRYMPKHTWANGDFAAIPQRQGYHIVTYHEAYVDEYMPGFESDKTIVPLLRQDQLQEMVGWSKPNKHVLLDDYEECIMGKFYELAEQFTSWEQLWLAVMMKEKYNKVWNGEEWVE